MTRLLCVAALSSTLVSMGLASAQDQSAAEAPEPSEDVQEPAPTFSHGYPVRVAQRPLVLDEGMVRADGRITVGGVRGPGTFSALDLGGAISPVEDLELGLSTELNGTVPVGGGVSLIGIIFSPKARYGDIPVYARYQFAESENALVAADLVLVLPTNTDFTLSAGVPLRIIELFGLFTLDMKLAVRYRNGDKFAGFVSDPAKNTVDFTFSGASVTNVTDRGYIEIGGGVGVVNVGGRSGARNVVELPFFIGGGYTYEGKLLVDIFAQFGWLPLMTANQPDGLDTFNVGDDWFVTVGTAIHTKSRFGGNAR